MRGSFRAPQCQDFRAPGEPRTFEPGRFAGFYQGIHVHAVREISGKHRPWENGISSNQGPGACLEAPWVYRVVVAIELKGMGLQTRSMKGDALGQFVESGQSQFNGRLPTRQEPGFDLELTEVGSFEFDVQEKRLIRFDFQVLGLGCVAWSMNVQGVVSSREDS